jgi:bifunctional non-homologous end joining protein LigD
LKLDRQEEFVVGGFRPLVRSVDALLVGYYEGGKLKFAGKVRAGLTPRIRAQLFDLLKRLQVQKCPRSSRTASAGSTEHCLQTPQQGD